MGNLAGSVRDFPRLLNQGMLNLKPGGWLEIVDFAPQPFGDDATLEQAPYMREWSEVIDKASVRFGKRMKITDSYKKWMIEAGFQDVEEQIYEVCYSIYGVQV